MGTYEHAPFCNGQCGEVCTGPAPAPWQVDDCAPPPPRRQRVGAATVAGGGDSPLVFSKPGQQPTAAGRSPGYSVSFGGVPSAADVAPVQHAFSTPGGKTFTLCSDVHRDVGTADDGEEEWDAGGGTAEVRRIETSTGQLAFTKPGDEQAAAGWDAGFDENGRRIFKRDRDGTGWEGGGGELSGKRARGGEFMGIGDAVTVAKAPTAVKDAPALTRVIGFSSDLEKSYSRSMDSVLQNNVRPVTVLEKAFTHVTAKGAEEGPVWLADQLKAIRQDLLVQGVEGAFAWRVYDAAAKLALEEGDKGEFTQILTQMRKMVHSPQSSAAAEYQQRSVMEYLAYRLLFTCLQRDHSALNEELLLVTPQARRFGSIKHAMLFIRAFAGQNHWKLVRLTHKAPNLGGSVIDLFLPSLRLLAYRRALKAYVPGIPFDVLGRQLFYPTADAASAASAFAVQHNGTGRKEDQFQSVDCKLSLAGLERLMKTEMNPQFADLQNISAEEELRRRRNARFTAR